MKKIVLIGGGVVGLSLAFELSSRGHQVTLLDINRVGRKSSRAGAGILLPGNLETATHPIEQLEAYSNHLHAQWHQRLLTVTDIDNGYWKCGGLYLARSVGETASLVGQQSYWIQRQISVEHLEPKRSKNRFSNLNLSGVKRILFLPDEAQLCNPHHLQALQMACQKQGGEILEQLGSLELVGDQSQLRRVEIQTCQGDKSVVEGDDYVIAAGAWSQQLTANLGFQIPTTPVRGQMVMFRLATALNIPIVNEGSRYLVPRRDGHVLAGATVEEVGFDEHTQASDIESLTQWAESLCDRLNSESRVAVWAGLRPGSFDALPYLGRLASMANVWIAAGHFKTGLQLSTGTAVAVSDLIEGKPPKINLDPFCPSRSILHRDKNLRIG